MQLLLGAARRTANSRWICQTCRRGLKSSSPLAGPDGGHATQKDVPLVRYTDLSEASKKLRGGGPARTRFAPSPTGYLHLGSLRTALFNYLVAKATGGQFLLRIEDTDQKRTIRNAEERLYEDLEWAGIQWDEGPKVGGPKGPYKQSERISIYREGAETLLQKGHAYRCFCSPERLNALAVYRTSQNLPPDYDRKCAHIAKEESDDRAAKGEAHVIRLLGPEKYPPYEDLVYGVVRSRQEMRLKPSPGVIGGSFDDPILIKSDGFPTYHLANVIDDHLMDITHVIRGSEWMSSTPKHIALYKAFDWEPPKFAHVGLLLDKDRQKLSKRTNSINIRSFRNQGIFPETLTNFIALLGWSHTAGQDVLSMEDLIQRASMKYTRGESVVAPEKLYFLQKRHAARYASSPTSENPLHDLRFLAAKPVAALLGEKMKEEDLPCYERLKSDKRKEDYVHQIVLADAQNYKLPSDFITRNTHFFTAPTISALNNSLPSMHLRKIPSFISPTPGITLFLKLLGNLFEIEIEEWNDASSTELRQGVAWMVERGRLSSMDGSDEHIGVEDDGVALEKRVQSAWSKLVHGYLRWALMAGNSGPDLVDVMRILGKDECVSRLKRAETVIRDHEDDGSAKPAAGQRGVDSEF